MLAGPEYNVLERTFVYAHNEQVYWFININQIRNHKDNQDHNPLQSGDNLFM